MAVAVCLGSGLSLAKAKKNFNERTRPLFVISVGDFYAFADVSNVALGFDACDEAVGEEQFFEVASGEIKGAEHAFAFMRPELGESCRVSALPGGVSSIRVVGRCPSGTVELTVFDGTTITPEIGETYLVGDPIVLPPGCDDVVAHRVVFTIEPPESESIEGPLSP